MKIILPVAGAGTRLRPHTLHLPKCLLPVAGSTILGHIVDSLAHLKATETIFITGYMAEKVETYVRKEYPHLNAAFVRQDNPQGLGEAIHLCASHLDQEPVLIVLGDTLFEADLDSLCQLPENALCTRKVEDPRRFGVAVTAGDDRIVKLVEKPAEFVSDQALVGIYWIRETQMLKQALAQLIQGNVLTRGEFQLTDALQSMISQGAAFRSAAITQWLDCGKPETLLETNRLVLDKSTATSYSFPGSTIIPPCSIAPDAQISNSRIGPHVSLSGGCHITDSELADCAIDSGAEISHSKLKGSILGKSTTVRNFQGILDLGECSIVDQGSAD